MSVVTNLGPWSNCSFSSHCHAAKDVGNKYTAPISDEGLWLVRVRQPKEIPAVVDETKASLKELWEGGRGKSRVRASMYSVESLHLMNSNLFKEQRKRKTDRQIEQPS